MECAVQFNFFQKIIIQIRPQWQVSECEKQNNKQIHLKLIRYRHGNFPDKRRDRRTLILLEKFPRIAGERIFFIIFSCSSKRPPSLLLRRMFARAFLSWNGTKIQGTVGGQVVASRGAFQSDSPREVWRGQVTETPDVFYLIFCSKCSRGWNTRRKIFALWETHQQSAGMEEPFLVRKIFLWGMKPPGRENRLIRLSLPVRICLPLNDPAGCRHSGTRVKGRFIATAVPRFTVKWATFKLSRFYANDDHGQVHPVGLEQKCSSQTNIQECGKFNKARTNRWIIHRVQQSATWWISVATLPETDASPPPQQVNNDANFATKKFLSYFFFHNFWNSLGSEKKISELRNRFLTMFTVRLLFPLAGQCF